MSSRDRGFLPAAALAECHPALDVAARGAATLEGAVTLMIGCSSLVANHSCRAGLREVLSAQPARHPREAVQRCADLYCPSLVEAATLAACRAPLPRAAEGATSIEIVADSGIPFQDVIVAMDALRELGYEHIAFGARR